MESIILALRNILDLWQTLFLKAQKELVIQLGGVTSVLRRTSAMQVFLYAFITVTYRGCQYLVISAWHLDINYASMFVVLLALLAELHARGPNNGSQYSCFWVASLRHVYMLTLGFRSRDAGWHSSSSLFSCCNTVPSLWQWVRGFSTAMCRYSLSPSIKGTIRSVHVTVR